jgi:hypothetical protein
MKKTIRKYATPANMFAFHEDLRFKSVDPNMIRICPDCLLDLGTLDQTEHWRFCPYCGVEILKPGPAGSLILLWGNQ